VIMPLEFLGAALGISLTEIHGNRMDGGRLTQAAPFLFRVLLIE